MLLMLWENFHKLKKNLISYYLWGIIFILVVLNLIFCFYKEGVQNVNSKRFQSDWYNIFIRDHELLKGITITINLYCLINTWPFGTWVNISQSLISNYLSFLT